MFLHYNAIYIDSIGILSMPTNLFHFPMGIMLAFKSFMDAEVVAVNTISKYRSVITLLLIEYLSVARYAHSIATLPIIKNIFQINFLESDKKVQQKFRIKMHNFKIRVRYKIRKKIVQFISATNSVCYHY